MTKPPKPKIVEHPSKPIFGAAYPVTVRGVHEDGYGDGDPKNPIYNLRFRWNEDGEHDPKYPKWHEGLPEGRVWNSTSVYKMYRTDPGLAAVEQDARDWWEPYKVSDKREGKNPSEPEITVEFIRNETWALSWFSHWTFDVGQSDAEALASFERFVARMQRLNADERKYIETEHGGYWHDAYCLMGAEDRWRWAGVRDDGGNTTPAPCRCDGCKKLGFLRIDH
jgi:hypothetical protein